MESPTLRQIKLMDPNSSWKTILDVTADRNSVSWAKRYTEAKITAALLSGRSSKFDEFDDSSERLEYINDPWTCPKTLGDRKFQVVLAHHALESYSQFEPEHAPHLLRRLKRHVGGRLYLSGIEIANETQNEIQFVFQQFHRVLAASRALLGQAMSFPSSLAAAVQLAEWSGYRVTKKHFVSSVVDTNWTRIMLARIQENLDQLEPEIQDEFSGLIGELMVMVPDPPESNRVSHSTFILQCEPVS